MEKKCRRGRQTTHSVCVCWHLHGHSQERQIHCQSGVTPTQSQDRWAGTFKSIILFGLWFWNHCTLQRVVLCGRWLQCYNYHHNYTGTFPSWRAPWNHSPVTWPGFTIVLVRWTIAFWVFLPGHKLIGLVRTGRPGMTRQFLPEQKTVLLTSTLTTAITCGSFRRRGGGGTKEPEHRKNLALQRRRTPWD